MVTRHNFAPLNELQMYYEVHAEGGLHGEGLPLVIAHGGSDTIDTCFAKLLPALAEHRQVVAFEAQGHGRTADVDRPLTYEQMGDDIAGLIEHLGFEQADVLGFSMGGGAAIQAAIRHPQRVRRLIVASAAMRDEGWYPEVFEGIRSSTPEQMFDSPWHESYLKHAPRKEDFATMLAKVRECVAGEPYDWTEQFGALTMPVLIVVGDADSVKVSHAVEMFERLGGGGSDGFANGKPRSRLLVLPGTHHLEVTSRIEQIVPAVDAFLDPEETSSEPFAMP